MTAWLLNHPSRLSWIILELSRPVGWKRKFANSWWQAWHYNDAGLWRTNFEKQLRAALDSEQE